ncbi:hypothetical protein [Alteromonas halophila]|uniref:Uncharacterized protein n=1 Tax=Alteromonas halophila TaxID=516698 RepID=A0A918JMA3_9ALTE|nr:hypothetical protein [Alteromonas halophila]GGW89711.1 hypothetical protein GCM10007391_25020 [Alteromonas halophila]
MTLPALYQVPASHVKTPIFKTRLPVFRIEIRRAANLAIAERPVFGCQLTLSSRWPVQTEFILTPGHTLGWLDHNRLDHLRVKAHAAEKCLSLPPLSSLLHADDGCLQARIPLGVYLLSDDISLMKQQGVALLRPL